MASHITRRTAYVFGAALALAACGGGDTTAASEQTVPVASAPETTLASGTPEQLAESGDTASDDTDSNDTGSDTDADTDSGEMADDSGETSSDAVLPRPADWDASQPFGYGDDADFDALWDSCAAGDSDACSTLFWTSPSDSAYEEFGLAGIDFTDNSSSDSTDEGTGDPLADALAMERPAGWDDSEPFTYGDDAGFDALWDSCEGGDSEACSELFWTSPSDSAYEAFGLDKSFE